MSNLWFNIRFGATHFQLGPDGPSIRVNSYHVENKPEHWFEIYCFFGRHFT